jgi:AraC-like DNA-binding protein
MPRAWATFWSVLSRLDLIDDWPGLARKAGYDAAELARMCGISPSQLRRYFGSVFRRPPQEWINELRMWDAMQMLAEGHAVTKVAVALKFSNIAHLSQRYKEYHGHPPSEFKSYLKGKKRRMLEEDDEDDLPPWRDAELRLMSPLQRKRR